MSEGGGPIGWLGKLISRLLDPGYMTYRPQSATMIVVGGRGLFGAEASLYVPRFPDSYRGLRIGSDGPEAVFATGDVEQRDGRLIYAEQSFNHAELLRRAEAAEAGQPTGASSVDIEAQRMDPFEQSRVWRQLLGEMDRFERDRSVAPGSRPSELGPGR